MRSRSTLFLAGLLSACAGGGESPMDALEAEEKRMAVMLRTQPPELIIHRADSLAALPVHAGDKRWRQAMLHNRGHALRLLGRLDEAMTTQIRVYELADSAGDQRGRMNAMLSLASIYMDLNDTTRAGRELAKVLQMSAEIPLERRYRVPLLMAAWSDYRQMGDSALYWCAESLKGAEAAQDSFVMADIHFNIGISSGGLGRMEESEQALKKALSVMPRSGYPQLEARVCDALGYMYLEQGRMEEVPPLLDRAEHLAVQHGAGDVLVRVLGDRIEQALALNDSATALLNIQRLLSVKDSIGGILRERALAEAQARFGVSRMERELALTQAEEEVNTLRAQRSRLAWGAMGVIAVLAASLVYSFHRQARLKQAAARVLEQDRERLLEENELLHQENLMARFETLKSQIDPHFLFNAMNTLYTLVETEPAKAREFIASFSALYRKVLNSRDRTIVPLQEELELVQHYLFLQRMRFGESLRVALNVPAGSMKAYLPPFTLQMLLENAIKHNTISASKPLHIEVKVEDDRLIVANDLRPRGTSEAGTGTGLENIRRRYTMLGAAEPEFRLIEDRYVASVPLMASEP